MPPVGVPSDKIRFNGVVYGKTLQLCHLFRGAIAEKQSNDNVFKSAKLTIC